jgi:hypothetical protein
MPDDRGAGEVAKVVMVRRFAWQVGMDESRVGGGGGEGECDGSACLRCMRLAAKSVCGALGLLAFPAVDGLP